MKTDRKDFLTKILEHRQSDNLSDVQIAAHSSDFVYGSCALSRYAPVANVLHAALLGVRPQPRLSLALHITFKGIPTSCKLCKKKFVPHSNHTNRLMMLQRHHWST